MGAYVGAATGTQNGADVLVDVENAIGGSANDLLTGNALANRLQGGNGADSLLGLGGADRLEGGAGADSIIGGAANDTLTGGTGVDRFEFQSGFGQDVVTDFAAGAGATDVLRIRMGTAFDTFHEIRNAATQAGADTVIPFDANTSITLTGVVRTSLVADDFLFV